MKELNGTIEHLDWVLHPRIAQKAFYLDREQEMETFLKGDLRTIPIPFTDQAISYDAMPRIGVGISKLGASRAIALGAYVFAVSRDDSKFIEPIVSKMSSILRNILVKYALKYPPSAKALLGAILDLLKKKKELNSLKTSLNPQTDYDLSF